jgi:hypothetical protein
LVGDNRYRPLHKLPTIILMKQAFGEPVLTPSAEELFS